jgi:hypothetical protein
MTTRDPNRRGDWKEKFPDSPVATECGPYHHVPQGLLACPNNERTDRHPRQSSMDFSGLFGVRDVLRQSYYYLSSSLWTPFNCNTVLIVMFWTT